MITIGYSFDAKCKMLETKIKIRSGARPNLFINGCFFPACIYLNSTEELSSNQTAIVSVKTILDEGSKDYFIKGVSFELHDGPYKPFSKCEILSDVKLTGEIDI